MFTGPVDLATYDSVSLVFLDGKLGDAIVNSSVVTAIKSSFPNISVRIFTTNRTASYWESWSLVDKVIIVPSRTGPRSKFDLYKTATSNVRQKDLAVSFDALNPIDAFLFMHGLKPSLVIGYMKHEYRLFDISLLDYTCVPDKKPFWYRVVDLLKCLGLNHNYPSIARHSPIDAQLAEKFSNDFKLDKTKPVYFLNTYGAAVDRTMSTPIIKNVIAEIERISPGSSIIVNLPTISSSEFSDVVTSGQVTFLGPLPDISSLFTLLSLADVVISPDTGVAHAAAALRKRQLTLFCDKNYNPFVWIPESTKQEICISVTGKHVNDQDWQDVFKKLAKL